ncbi:MAG: peptide ABC transporter substrate-binding protein [Cyanobacteria bacterium]|nr:peptide ABC transporter substrate-binding protein [Cyanobacteriota bacterium]
MNRTFQLHSPSPLVGTTLLVSRFVLLLALVLISCNLSACSSNKKRYEPGTLRMNLGSEPPSLDWHTTTDSNSYDVIANVMIGLTQYTQKLECKPSCASSWEILDGGKRYVFHLRDDIFWSDGKPVTAHDFEYAWRRLEDPATGGSYAFFLYDVENAQRINTGLTKDLSELGAHAIDDKTFEVRLKKPTGYFLYLTATCATFPMRKDVVEKHGNRWTEPENIVTNGPFLLDKWQHEYKIELAANQRFCDGKPALDRVKMFMVPEQSTAFALYENDELDYVDNRSFSTSDVHRYKDSPEYHSFPLLRGTYVGFNVTKPPFTDKRIRRAVAMAIDKSVFPKILRRGEVPSPAWIPQGLPGYSADSGLPYDVAKARSLLAEAGYPDGRGLPPISFLYPNREDSKLVVEALQAQLKESLNLRIELMNQEWKVYLATRKNDPPPLFRGSWNADFPDSETFMNLFTSQNGNNCTRWKNEEYDRLVAGAAGELDRVKRDRDYQRADTILCRDECPIVPMYVATQNVLLKPWLKGLLFNALDVQYFKTVRIGETNKSVSGNEQPNRATPCVTREGPVSRKSDGGSQ